MTETSIKSDPSKDFESLCVDLWKLQQANDPNKTPGPQKIFQLQISELYQGLFCVHVFMPGEKNSKTLIDIVVFF